MRLWTPTTGHFENLSLEILDLFHPQKAVKPGSMGGVEYIYIYIYTHCILVLKGFLQGSLYSSFWVVYISPLGLV